MGAESLKPEDARVALESANAMTRAGARRGRAPCWLRVGFALFLGLFVALHGMTTTPGAVAPLFGAAMVFFIILGGPDSVMARPRQESSTFRQVLTILGFAAVTLAAALGGVALRVKLGLIWAPLALGVLVAAATFAFVEIKTRAWIARQGAGDAA